MNMAAHEPGACVSSSQAAMHASVRPPPNGETSRASTQNPRQGRRLIQMLFRSNNEEDALATSMQVTGDSVANREHGHVSKHSTDVEKDSRLEEDDGTQTPSNSKFGALKRKLFPSKKRRHPARIPPLVISPIATPNKGGNNQRLPLELPNEDGRDGGVPADCQPISGKVDDSCDVHTDAKDRNGYEFEDDDDEELLKAIEVADLMETAVPEEALVEMTLAIDNLRAWKQKHEENNRMAMRDMETRLANETSAISTEQDDTESLQVEAQEFVMNQHERERARERLSVALREAHNLITTAAQVKDEQISRVLFDAKRTTKDDSNASADSTLSRLRAELFNLQVKELQTSLGRDVDETDMELTMTPLDVEAFKFELDHVLAQFDAIGSSTDTSIECTTPSNS